MLNLFFHCWLRITTISQSICRRNTSGIRPTIFGHINEGQKGMIDKVFSKLGKPLAECYVQSYPGELDIFKLLLELSAVAWVLGAMGMSAFNLFSIWRQRGKDD